MRHLKFFYIISLLMLISCNPCEEIDCPNPFTEEELQWLPYSEGDKIVFLDFNSSDSLIYRITSKKSRRMEPTEDVAPYCQTSCYYRMSVIGDRTFSNGEEERSGFGMDKTIREFRLSYGGDEFDLTEAVHLDSLAINGTYIKDVYKYVCKPEQDQVAESYMHQGMGLVKIVFRDGQEFELVEHIKAK